VFLKVKPDCRKKKQLIAYSVAFLTAGKQVGPSPKVD
jgi:hypothetical protein